MRNVFSRPPVRTEIVDPQKEARKEFDAMMVSLRKLRQARCAARNTPAAPRVEAA